MQRRLTENSKCLLAALQAQLLRADQKLAGRGPESARRPHAQGALHLHAAQLVLQLVGPRGAAAGEARRQGPREYAEFKHSRECSGQCPSSD